MTKAAFIVALLAPLGACVSRVIDGRASAGSVGTGSSIGSSSGTSAGATSASSQSSSAAGTNGSSGGSSAGTGNSGTSGTSGTATSSGTTTGPCPQGEGLFLGGCIPNQVCGPNTIWDGDTCVALDCAINARATCLTADGGRGECASGVCLDLKHDPQNCGSYGFACAALRQCVNGSCWSADSEPVCDPPHVETFINSPSGPFFDCLLEACAPAADDQLCGTAIGEIGFCCHGDCILGDSDNCAGCGLICEEGSVCAGGLAGCTPAVDCSTAVANAICRLSNGTAGSCCDGSCLDEASDPASCGTCGMAVPRREDCVNGAPTGSCKQDVDCPSGTICAYGEACLQSTCPPGSEGAECGLGEGAAATHGTCCGGTCVVNNFCGATCNVCQAGSTCLRGLCVPLGECGAAGGSDPPACATDAGTVGSCCGSACVDLTTDPSHCGLCSEACPLGATCGSGFCSMTCTQSPCPTGFECIANRCYSETCATSWDPCAAGGLGGQCCGKRCAVFEPENSGSLDCGAVCPIGSPTETACLDPDSGAPPCGPLGSGPCPAGDICKNGICQPMLNCSSDVAPQGGSCLTGPNTYGTCCGGACVNSRSDPRNCGLCGIVCASGICSGAQGSICLPAGATDDCQETCGLGMACVAGSCVGSSCGLATVGIVPNPGSYCVAEDGTIGECCEDGACAHLRDDPQNCGLCGYACAPGQACVGGMCEGWGCPIDRVNEFCNPDAGPSWICCLVAGCVDLLWDSKNCGSCGWSCSAGESCDAGWCS